MTWILSNPRVVISTMFEFQNLISPSSLINHWSIDLTSFFNRIRCQILDRMKWMTIMWMQMSIKQCFPLLKKVPYHIPIFCQQSFRWITSIIKLLLEMKWMKVIDELLVLFGWGKRNPCERWTYKFVNELLTWTPKPTI